MFCAAENASESHDANYDFVLVCVHYKLLFTYVVRFISFFWVGCRTASMHAGCSKEKKGLGRCKCQIATVKKISDLEIRTWSANAA